MDVDDIYVQRDAFRTLYVEAEKNNLDILGFVFTSSEGTITRKILLLEIIKELYINLN